MVMTQSELQHEIALRIFDNDFGGVTAALARIVLNSIVESAILHEDIPDLNELLRGAPRIEQGVLIFTENDGSEVRLTLPEAGDPGTVTGTVEDFRLNGTVLSIILERTNNVQVDLAPILQPVIDSVMAEAALRASGDALTSIQVSSDAQLTSALTAQLTSDEQLEIVFTARAGHGGETYQEGDVIHVAPRSDAVERRFNIRQGGGGGGAENLPPIAEAVPEDGFNYLLLSRDRTGSGGTNDPIAFYVRAYPNTNSIGNFVPNAPGSAAGVGRVLTVFGEGDKDYRWETFNVGAAVMEYLRTNPISGGRAFGSGSGQIAPQAEGNNTDKWPLAKLDVDSKQTRRAVVQVAPDIITDKMVGASPTFLITAHVNTEDIPAGATHFRGFVGRSLGDLVPVSNIVSGGDPVRTFVPTTSLDLRADFSAAIRESAKQSRLIQAGFRFTDSDGAAQLLNYTTAVAVLTEAPLVVPIRSVLELPPITMGAEVRQLEVFSRVASVYEINADASFRVDPSDTAAVDGQEIILRVTQDSTGGRTIDFNASVRTIPGVPARSLNSQPNQLTILRLERIGGHWYYTGRVTQETSSGGGGGGLNQAQVDARIAPYARATPSGQIADAQIPAAIARDSEVAAIGDLRTRYNQSATPVAQDRFFFTDENQSGDPIRYVVFNNLAAAINGAQSLASGDLALRSGVLGLSDARRSEFGSLAGADIWLRDEQAAPIAPTQANQDKILWRWWEERAYKNRPTHYTAPTLAKRDLASSDLPVGYTWGGVITRGQGSGVNNAVWYNRDPNVRAWQRRISNFTVFWTPNFPFLGYFDTEAQAAAAASAFEDAHGAGSVTGSVYVVVDRASVITGLTDREPDEFAWVPIESDYILGSNNLDADTAEKQKALRAAIGAAAVFVGTTLPAGTAVNNGDWVIITTDVSSGLVWQDFAGNRLTSAEAGDLGVYVGGRTWQRLGNMIKGPAKIRTQVLTSAAAITWNVASGHTATLTLGVNTTLRLTGGEDGDVAMLKVKQDSTGSRTLTLHSTVLRFKDIAAPVLSTAADTTDLLMFVNDGGTWAFVGLK